ncbi:MAG: SDR family oxidoreductase [Parvibaculales bacterium]
MTKTALITGGAKRIGKAIALGLAQQGWQIAIHYGHSGQEADELVAQLQTKNVKAIALQADLADASQVETLIPRAAEAFGEINLLVNNASVFERDTATDFTTATWDTHLNVNLRAPALLMRDFAGQTSAGNIINIIDQRVWRLTPDFSSYTVSKTGLWSLTQTFAQALAEKNIRVNGIGPGPTLPNPRQDQAEFDKQTRLVPLGHGASPEEVADAVMYILSANSMTGQMIALDGGQHLAWKTPDVTEVVE